MRDDFGQECLCGSTDFERVIVERPPSAPIVTDFLACLNCRTMLFLPQEGQAQPIVDTHDDLMREVKIAARDYRKPGRGRRHATRPERPPAPACRRL